MRTTIANADGVELLLCAAPSSVHAFSARCGTRLAAVRGPGRGDTARPLGGSTWLGGVGGQGRGDTARPLGESTWLAEVRGQGRSGDVAGNSTWLAGVGGQGRGDTARHGRCIFCDWSPFGEAFDASEMGVQLAAERGRAGRAPLGTAATSISRMGIAAWRGLRVSSGGRLDRLNRRRSRCNRYNALVGV